MNPEKHARSSVHAWGGRIEDYMEIHNWMDHTKAHLSDFRHRTVLHNSWGIALAEQVFGTYFLNSDGRTVYTREIAERHVVEDLGTIPSLKESLASMTVEPWMGGPPRRRKVLTEREIRRRLERFRAGLPVENGDDHEP